MRTFLGVQAQAEANSPRPSSADVNLADTIRRGIQEHRKESAKSETPQQSSLPPETNEWVNKIEQQQRDFLAEQDRQVAAKGGHFVADIEAGMAFGAVLLAGKKMVGKAKADEKQEFRQTGQPGRLVDGHPLFTFDDEPWE